ncbi:MAG: hypothetical protein LH609_16540, partial [Rudanella sp.]|nr:hypothetical protein [Rudanella sp.]
TQDFASPSRQQKTIPRVSKKPSLASAKNHPSRQQKTIPRVSKKPSGEEDAKSCVSTFFTALR